MDIRKKRCDSAPSAQPATSLAQQSRRPSEIQAERRVSISIYSASSGIRDSALAKEDGAASTKMEGGGVDRGGLRRGPGCS